MKFNNYDQSPLIEDLSRFLDLKKYPRGYSFSIHLSFIIFRYVLTSSAFRSIYFYRVLNNPQIKKRRFLKKIIWIIGLILNEINIPPSAKIGGGLLIPHGKCIIIHNKSIIGKNVTISQGVTIGGNIFKKKNGRTSPIIGDNVLLSAGSKILGPVLIGENSIIGANAVVITDIPKNSVAVGVPAKVVKKIDKSFFEISETFK